MTVTVKDLIGEATVLAGRAGLGRAVKVPQVITPDLSLPSTWSGMDSGVIHVTPTQSAYLRTLSGAERVRLIRALLKQRPSCIIVGGTASGELLKKAEAAGTPVLKSRNLLRLSRQLVEMLTPRVSMHGVLVEAFGLGTLIIGVSAIGKSEAALDLVLRGHKLVADDLVVLERTEGRVTGRAEELGAGLLEIRGLGIVDVRALYGESATSGSCAVGLVVELEEWKKGRQYSLLGLRERRYRLLGVNLPYLRLPVKPGRNMATLIEVAVRNQLLKNRGIFTARELNRRLKKRLAG